MKNAPQQAFAALAATRPPATRHGRERQAILQQEARACQERRDRLFKHEWAKKRLCAILLLVRPDQWNGYLPTRSQPLPAASEDGAKPNLSAERRHLIQLLYDVRHFEETGELPDYALETDGDE